MLVYTNAKFARFLKNKSKVESKIAITKMRDVILTRQAKAAKMVK